MEIRYNVEKMSKILDDICVLTGVAMAIADSEYNWLYVNNSMSYEYCSLIQQSADGMEKCKRCDETMLKKAKELGAPFSHICHAGLCDTGVPIRKDGITVGYIVFGRVRSTDTLEADRLGTLCGYGISAEEITVGFGRTVFLSDEKRERLLHLLSHMILEHAIEIDYDEFIGKATDFINANLASDLSVQTVCRKLFVSKNYLYKSFRSFYGKTLNEYITDQRIKRAKELLVQSSESISKISSDVGIENYTYFTKLFKKKTGFSPAKYRAAYS